MIQLGNHFNNIKNIIILAGEHPQVRLGDIISLNDGDIISFNLANVSGNVYYISIDSDNCLNLEDNPEVNRVCVHISGETILDKMEPLYELYNYSVDDLYGNQIMLDIFRAIYQYFISLTITPTKFLNFKNLVKEKQLDSVQQFQELIGNPRNMRIDRIDINLVNGVIQIVFEGNSIVQRSHVNADFTYICKIFNHQIRVNRLYFPTSRCSIQYDNEQILVERVYDMYNQCGGRQL